MTSVRIISGKLVKELLPMSEAIDVNRKAFESIALGLADVPTRIIMPFAAFNGSTLIKPAYISEQALGVKVVSVRPSNASLGLATVPAIIMLFDIVTAQALCIMEGTYLTALRTAAGSGVSTLALARGDASLLVVFGAGLQADLHIRAILVVRPIRRVVVVNRTVASAERLVESLKMDLGQIEFSVTGLEDVAGVEAAVRSADIIVTATNSATPLFDGKWLKQGCHINAVGSYTPQARELDTETVLRSRVYLDSEAAQHAGDIAIPTSAGQQPIGGITTIGAHLIARESPSPSAAHVSIFKSVGTAVQDIMTANAVYLGAVARDLGTTAEL